MGILTNRSPGFVPVWRALTFMTMLLTASHAYSASKTVLVLGDSLSAGYGLTREAGWVSLLAQRLQHERIEASVINASISGDTTSGGRARLPALLENQHPSVVVIELGGNDGLRGLPLRSAEDNLRAMIAEARKARAQVLLIGMRIPPNYGPQYTEQFSGMYMKAAKDNGVPLVPFLLEKVALDPSLLQPDRIHPTAAAQPLLLDTVWPYLKPMLEKSKQ